jgi:hypothetical protein
VNLPSYPSNTRESNEKEAPVSLQTKNANDDILEIISANSDVTEFTEGGTRRSKKKRNTMVID